MNITSLAPAPSRATTSVTLAFGLLNIPLSVYTGTEETRVNRKEFLNGDPTIEVGRAPIRKDTGDVVNQADVTRLAQGDNGAWVSLSDDEIAACTSPRGVAEIVAFVKNTKVGGYLVEDVKQVRSKREKGKLNVAAEKAFALLLSAMAERKVHALVRVAMRGPARYALLDTNGNLFLVHSADQVRGPLPATTSFDFTPQEQALAGNLIDAVGIDAPVLLDTTAPVVQEFVNAKAAGVTVPEVVAPVANPVDLMGQLLASLEASKAGAK